MTDWCGHFSFDINGDCMRCGSEDRERDIMAAAWDEGFRHCQLTRHSGRSVDNPYKTPHDLPAHGTTTPHTTPSVTHCDNSPSETGTQQ